MDDAHHALDLLGRDGPRARLLPQQVHHVVGELAAGLEPGGRDGERVSRPGRVKTRVMLMMTMWMGTVMMINNSNTHNNNHHNNYYRNDRS